MIEISKPNEVGKGLFSEENSIADFFMAGSRGEILRQLVAAVHAGTSLMILAGEEGSGKTMLCRMLEKELASDTRVVYFTQSIESFEDVIKGLADRFGFGNRLDSKEKLFDSFYKNLALFLQQEPGRVVVIFDEAENLYLATLERIRKLLDRITLDGAYLQFLFSGRLTLLDNIEQLNICDFKNKDELSIVLPGLTGDESIELIEKIEKKLVLSGGKAVADDIRMSIVDQANGNFKKIFLLTREAAQNQGDDTSFMVLLENIKSSEPDVEVAETKAVRRYYEQVLQYKKYFPYLGAVMAVFVALVWGLMPDSKEELSEKPEGEVKTAVKVVAPPVAPIAIESKMKKNKKSAAASDSVKNARPSSAEAKNQMVSPKRGAGTDDINNIENGVKTYSLGEAGKTNEQLPKEVEQAIIKTVTEKVAKEPIVLQANTSHQDAPPTVVKIKEIVRKESKVVELWPSKELKKKPEVEVIAAKQTKQIVSSKNAVQEVVASNSHLTTDQLLRKRMVASAPWQRGKKDDQYTVQLMVLTAKNGKDNFKKMLEDEEYRKEANNFFVFKKRSSPDVLMIFYGEYPTMSFARLAKNNLPEFLLKHKPYPISVKEAMGKVNQ